MFRNNILYSSYRPLLRVGMITVTLSAVLLILASCKGSSTATILDNAVSVEMKYSQLLKIQQGDGFVLAEIKNPWDTTKMLHSYILVPKDREIPANIPQGEIIRTPLSNSVFYTSVHATLIDTFGAYDAISGVCDGEYMYLDRLRKDIATGKVVDCGNGLNPNIEKIIDLSPDAILLSPFENSGTYGKLGTIGIPIIECADYMETGALGRAEWMRFYGLLVGKQEMADSIFATIENDYNTLKKLVENVKHRPTVVDGKKFGSSWYIAGANSTVGRMISDAGGQYVFNDERATGSVPYDPEKVFDRSQDADIWMLKYRQDAPLTYNQLAKEWANYAQMNAFKNKNVYACNLMKVAFYEETPFYPNILLRDYIKIFHPDVLKDYQSRYFIKMTE